MVLLGLGLAVALAGGVGVALGARVLLGLGLAVALAVGVGVAVGRAAAPQAQSAQASSRPAADRRRTGVKWRKAAAKMIAPSRTC